MGVLVDEGVPLAEGVAEALAVVLWLLVVVRLELWDCDGEPVDDAVADVLGVAVWLQL